MKTKNELTIVESAKIRYDKHNRLIQARNATLRARKALETAETTEANCQTAYDLASEDDRQAQRRMK